MNVIAFILQTRISAYIKNVPLIVYDTASTILQNLQLYMSLIFHGKTENMPIIRISNIRGNMWVSSFIVLGIQNFSLKFDR